MIVHMWQVALLCQNMAFHLTNCNVIQNLSWF